MEDFIERVGQSYLERKAFAVPQQLENLTKKQLTGGDEERATAKELAGKTTNEEEERGEREVGRSSTKKKGSEKKATQTSSAISEKDKEIARLKKQLAQLTLEKPKASSRKSTSGLKESGISRMSNGQKAFTKKASRGGKGTKESAGLGEKGAVGGNHIKRKTKGSEKAASGSELAKEANIVEISPTKRTTSASQKYEHEGGAKSEHGAGSKSEPGSLANSVVSHPAAASEGTRRPSMASHSEHGSTAKSYASGSIHERLPAHAFGEERATVESQQLMREDEQERDLYAVEVEVEEEVPRGGREDTGWVVEVESSQGRTVYRIE